MNILAVVLGGGIGAFLRYSAYRLSYKLFIGNFAWGTLLINLSGSFIIGFLWSMLDLNKLSTNFKNFVFIGILGSYTTFSTYTLDSFNYLKSGDLKLFFLNLFLQNLLGIMFVFLGYMLGRILKQTVA